MFVEHLTKEQLCKFFNVNTLSFFMNSKDYQDEKNYLYVSYEREGICDSMTINNRMYDFEGSTCGSEKQWRKFLYEIFGNEYIQEYKKWLTKQNELKIKEILE